LSCQKEVESVLSITSRSFTMSLTLSYICILHLGYLSTRCCIYFHRIPIFSFCPQ
jgi:hypothetical protein